MEIVSLLVGILGIAVACFAVGYAIGKDIHRNDDNTRK